MPMPAILRRIPRRWLIAAGLVAMAALVAGGIPRLMRRLMRPTFAEAMVWNHADTKPQAGSVHATFPSAAVGQAVGYDIYLPPAYAAEPARRFPVVYFLHGLGGNENFGGYPLLYLERAIRDGRVPPMIVVHPNACDSYWCDSVDGKVPTETTVIRELIPHVDATYRTIADRGGRAIQGMSMGGFGCLHLAFAHPELFSSVVAFAAAVRDPGEMDGRRETIMQGMFANDPERFRAAHPAELLSKNRAAITGGLAISIYVGGYDRFFSLNRNFHALLDREGIVHDYREIPGIGHNLGLLAAQIKADGFAFAAAHFLVGGWASGPSPNNAPPSP